MNLHRLKKRLRRLYRKTLRSLKRWKRHLRGANRGQGHGYDGTYGGGHNERGIRHYREMFDSNRLWYVAYILVMSVLCIFLAGTIPNINFKKWRRERSNIPTINKGIELEMAAKDVGAGVGQFITYYGYRRLGAMDPMEIDPNAPMVAFTFDDGPSAESTDRILAALAANYSHATFFVVGRQTDKFPEKLQNILSSGCEIGNHTYDHRNLVDLSESDINEQIGNLDRSVKNATGEETTVIRPPYGAYDEKVMGILNKPVILWDVDSEDWKSRNAQTICTKVLAEVKDGDIILMHDLYETTAEAVELMLPKLKEQGYQIVTVSEMAKYKGKELELGTAYGKVSQ